MSGESRAVPQDPEPYGALEAVAATVRRLCKSPNLVVTPETRLADLPGLDSLRALHLVATLEDQFGVEIDVAVLSELRRVSDILHWLEKR